MGAPYGAPAGIQPGPAPLNCSIRSTPKGIQLGPNAPNALNEPNDLNDHNVPNDRNAFVIKKLCMFCTNVPSGPGVRHSVPNENRLC